MKKQYVFILLITIMLYTIYLIIDTKYSEYKQNTFTELIEKDNEIEKLEIEKSKMIVDNRLSKSYADKIKKEQQWLKNKWEIVYIITDENKYNKFTRSEPEKQDLIDYDETKNSITDWMTIYQKWIYFLFKDDPRI